MFNVCIGCTVLPTPVPNPSDPTSINTRSYRRFLLQDGEKSGEGGGGEVCVGQEEGRTRVPGIQGSHRHGIRKVHGTW